MLLTLRVELVICNAALSPAKLSFFFHMTVSGGSVSS